MGRLPGPLLGLPCLSQSSPELFSLLWTLPWDPAASQHGLLYEGKFWHHVPCCGQIPEHPSEGTPTPSCSLPMRARTAAALKRFGLGTFLEVFSAICDCSGVALGAWLGLDGVNYVHLQECLPPISSPAPLPSPHPHFLHSIGCSVARGQQALAPPLSFCSGERRLWLGNACDRVISL